MGSRASVVQHVRQHAKEGEIRHSHAKEEKVGHNFKNCAQKKSNGDSFTSFETSVLFKNVRNRFVFVACFVGLFL